MGCVMSGLGELAQRIDVDDGQVIFEEGDRGNSVFVVEAGAVDIVKTNDDEDEITLATLKAGAMFGEMAIIDGSPRMATAIANGNAVLLRIPAELLQQKLDKFDPFMQALVRILVRNLRNVHRVYMQRPRSVSDHLNAVVHHFGKVLHYLPFLDDGDLKAQAEMRVETLSGLLDDLTALFEGHDDRRQSVLTDFDLPG